MITTLIQSKTVDGMTIELHDYSNWHENPEEYLAQIATLSWGKSESKNPKALWERLKTESGGNPSTVFEFLWCESLFDPYPQNMRWFMEAHLDNNIKFCPEWIKNNIITFKLKIPIYVKNQLIRHRKASYNEVSLRRVKSGFEFHIPDRLEQYAEYFNVSFVIGGVASNPASYYVKDCTKSMLKIYNKLLEMDVPPELARSVLPLSTMTTLWAQYTYTEKSWNNLLKLRLDHHTQTECREVVQAMKDLVDNNLYKQ